MDTKERIIDIVSDKLGINKTEIKLENSLTEDFAADSLDVVEIIMGIEKDFGITIDDTEISGIKTVGDVVDKIEKIRFGR